MTDNIKKKIYRICIDPVAEIFDKIAFWTLASQVENDNGQTLQETVGEIKGISTNLTDNKAGFVVDSTVLKQFEPMPESEYQKLATKENRFYFTY